VGRSSAADVDAGAPFEIRLGFLHLLDALGE
jgi:hypothetical protein